MEKIYIDFDGTLFDTDKFYKDFINVCSNYNIDLEKVDSSKELLFLETNLFDMDIIVDYLINKYKLSLEFKDEVNKLFSSKYVFFDVIPCLEILKKTHELIILTYGRFNYQTRKINGSNLKGYFKDIIITDKNKSTLSNIDYKNSIFIDNNPEEIKRFKEVGAKKVIRIRRDVDKYSKKDLEVKASEYTSFKEILEKEFS